MKNRMIWYILWNSVSFGEGWSNSCLKNVDFILTNFWAFDIIRCSTQLLLLILIGFFLLFFPVHFVIRLSCLDFISVILFLFRYLLNFVNVENYFLLHDWFESSVPSSCEGVLLEVSAIERLISLDMHRCLNRRSRSTKKYL